MKASTFILITILSNLLFMTRSLAQISSPPNTVPSANTLSSKLSDETSVSFYSGVSQINIPLYTIKKGDISVPIALNYNASGVRPDIHPGWVGLGWQLQPGGAITRVVKDLPDDFSSTQTVGDPDSTQISLNNAGYNWRYSKLNPSNWNDTTYMQSVSRSYDIYRDTEPDEYTFNVPGLNGKFFMNYNGQWKIQCERPIKISADWPNKSFTITGDDGTQYTFGGGSTPQEIATNIEMTALRQRYPYTSNQQTIGSWFLTKIKSEKGDVVRFLYEIDNNRTVQTVQVMSGSFDQCHAFSGLDTTILDYETDHPIYLKKIDAGDITVDFDRSLSTELGIPGFFGLPTGIWKQLDKISIKLVSGEFLLGYKFGYTNDISTRLTLLNLTELGKNSRTKPPYNFYYDSSKPLPLYLSDKVDHWGFYNGQSANYGSTVEAYYNSRNPNEEYLFAGVLNKIINPNGGVSEFTYEPNRFGRQLTYDRSQSPELLTQDQLSGGLRIRKVRTYDPDFPEQKKETEYFYVKNYTNSTNLSSLRSSGVLGGRVQYQYSGYFLNVYNHPGQVYAPNILNSQSVIPGYSNSSGSHIGYSEVVERRSDGSYTKYFFTNFDNGHLDELADNYLQPQRTVYDAYNSKETERGKLYLQKDYNASNQLVHSRGTTYTPINPTNNYVRAIRANHYFPCPDLKVEEGTAYRIYTYVYLPTAERDTLYDLTGSQPFITSSTTSYGATNNLLVTNVSTTNSRGEQVSSSFKYPIDMFAQDPTNVYHAMVDENFVNAVVEVKKTKDNVQMSVTKASYTTFTYGVVPESVSLQTVPTDPFRLKEQYQYDYLGNMTCRFVAQGPKTCYIRSYNYKYVVAEITNAEYEDVVSALGGASAVQAFQSVIHPTDASINTFLAPLRTSPALKNAMIKSYTYAPYTGMTSITDEKGFTIYHQYDEFLRPSVIKDNTGNILKQFNYNIK